MSIVGIFTQSRPSIDGFVFDAVLEESTEMVTDVTEFPIESGTIGNDHAVQRPMTLTMRVGVSDNPFRALRAQAGDTLGPLASNLDSSLGGFALSRTSEEIAVAAGLGASLLNASYAAGQSSTRSQNALDLIRGIQRSNRLINVVASKRSYTNCMITSTRQETTKENESALELVVKMTQLIIVSRPARAPEIPAQDDTAATQAQNLVELGLRQ